MKLFIAGDSPGLKLLLQCIFLLHSFGVDKAADSLLVGTLHNFGMLTGYIISQSQASNFDKLHLVDIPSKSKNSIAAALTGEVLLHQAMILLTRL